MAKKNYEFTQEKRDKVEVSKPKGGGEAFVRDDSKRLPAISQRCGGGRRVMRKKLGGD